MLGNTAAERSVSSGDILARLGLTPVINVAGTMTVIGASSALPEVIEAVGDILPRFVDIAALQRVASSTIARLCNAESGFVTASTSGAVTLAIAAAITGLDRAAMARLPDTRGLRNEVVVLSGHLVSYGAPIDQAIRLAGATVAPVGQSTSSAEYELEAAFNANTAAALYVVSHHAAQYGMIPLPRFSEIAHSKGVPVIVDAAAEYDLKKFIAEGADLVLYSAHKFLRAPTAGIVAGRRDLVRAAYLQNGGIGRGFKVGKEGIVGTIVALEAWEKADHAQTRKSEQALLDFWVQALANRAGIRASIVPDITGNPLDRVRVDISPEQAFTTAWDLTSALAAGSPSVVVRSEELEHGFFELDPCNLDAGEARIVAERIVAELDRASTERGPVTAFADWRSRQESAIWDI
jgi:D-glucosaminate-6-phosphate ammonia-lyase